MSGRMFAPGDVVTTSSKVVTMGLPNDYDGRKALPVFRGVLAYFPDAIKEVARVSAVGNNQHNPGEPLHWARDKSTEHFDTALRHMMDHECFHNPIDTDETWHLAKAAWRILAALQTALEAKAIST